MIMNGVSGINWGRSLRGDAWGRRPIPDRPDASENVVDIGDIDVDALLADGDEARYQRHSVESLRGDAATPALNALQKWMFEHNSPTQDWKKWRLVYNVMTRLSGNSDQLPKQTFIEWVDFDTNKPVKSGAFGDVFNGTYGGMPVAVKRLKLGDPLERESAEHYRRFRREALIWFQLRHPNILELKGIFDQIANHRKYPCMISPWVDGGTITEYIKTPEYDPRTKRIPLLVDVAQGLDYVHQRGVFHGDFHDGNILIHQGRARLTDFGMTVVGDKSHSAIPTTQLPANAIRWIAPELLSDENYIPRKTWEGDMFGFGRLCVAICTKGVLFPKMSETEVTLALYDENKRNPKRPMLAECDGLEMSDQLWNLASDCWKEDTSSRPRAAEGLRRLVAHS